MKIRAFDIDWDTTGFDEEEELQTGVCVPDLPSEVIFECDVDPDEEGDKTVSDILSDRYGFCVNGCMYEILSDDDPREPKFYEENWVDDFGNIGEINAAVHDFQLV